MKMLFYILMSGVLAGLLYYVLSAVLHVPSNKAVNAIMFYDKSLNTANGDLFDKIGLSVYLFMQRHGIPYQINEYKRKKINKALILMESKYNPEEYMIVLITKVVAIALSGLLFGTIMHPFIGLLLVILSIYAYFASQKELIESVEHNTEQIERELPMFVATIAQELTATRNVRDILERYATMAGKALRTELEYTISDMIQGDELLALQRMDFRIDSPNMHDVCFYLQSVIRGNDNASDFRRIADKLKDMQELQMRHEAEQIPKKLRMNYWGIAGAFMILILYVLVVMFNSSLNAFF